MQLQAFMFMGRPGSGKGTQVNLLIDQIEKKDPSHKALHIELGAEFRSFNEGPSYTAKHAKKVVDSGGLMPEFMPVYLWAKAMIDRFDGTQHVIFDGSPRKLLEAELMEKAAAFYGFNGNVIYLDVHTEESTQRLLLRGKNHGRKDDIPEAIKVRQATYEKETQPTVEFLRSRPHMHFHHVDGIGTIEEVHARIVKALGL